jgi:hypothetical protein
MSFMNEAARTISVAARFGCRYPPPAHQFVRLNRDLTLRSPAVDVQDKLAVSSPLDEKFLKEVNGMYRAGYKSFVRIG